MNLYYGSAYIENTDGRKIVSAKVGNYTSVNEALGSWFQTVSLDYPMSKGWYMPSISVHAVPGWLIERAAPSIGYVKARKRKKK